MRRNLAKERAGRPHATLRWLESDRLAFFLSVGLGGLLPDGSEDPAFAGRNAARNRAFGELLAASGLRAQEASLLLVHELPTAVGPRDRLVALNVPAAVAKGGVARRTIVSTAALRMIESYMRLERPTGQRRWSPAGALQVQEASADGGRVGERLVRWATLDVHARARLVKDGAALTWPLSAGGGPMVDWSDVFARATERCRAVEPGFPRVTPHTLRHTFAVHTLRRLVSQTVRRVREHEDDPALDVLAGYWRVHDPLLALRDLLGHASITTTQVYLHAIDPTRLLASVDEELEASVRRGGWEMSSGLIEVPLGLELVFPGGRVRHDYSQLPAPRVVRALARAHLSLTNSGGGIKTPGTSWLYARAIRRIAPFFERELAIDALGALDADAYRRLIADLGGGHLESCARALLLRLVETDPDAVHPSVRPLLVAPYLLEQPQSVPIPPLSGADAKRVEAACKQSILALEARLAEGERLLEPVDGAGANSPKRSGSSGRSSRWSRARGSPAACHAGFARIDARAWSGS